MAIKVKHFTSDDLDKRVRQISRENLLADIKRALQECFPDRAEVMIRNLEFRLFGLCTSCMSVLIGRQDSLCRTCFKKQQRNTRKFHLQRFKMEEGGEG